MGTMRQLPVQFRQSPIIEEGSAAAYMNEIRPIFGECRLVVPAIRALPWGILHTATVQITPKVHNMQWYTSGFT